MLGTRLLVSGAVVPPLVLVVYLGGWPLALVAIAALLLGAHELDRILARADLPCFRYTLVTLGVAILLCGAIARLDLWRIVVPLGLIAGAIAALLSRRPPREAAMAWAVTVTGAAYLGLPLGAGLALRASGDDVVLMLGPLGLQRGAVWLALALAITWLGDSGAYFVGRSLGRHPLCPAISPKKTVEGMVGGLVVSAAIGLLVGPVLGVPPAAALLLGIVAGAAGVVGDLAESLLKRAADIKDSGTLFPGHGGLLDRVDSMLFVFAVVYCVEELTRLPIIGW